MRSSEAATLFQRIEVLPGRRVRQAAVASLLLLVLGVLSGCASVAPGSDPVVVRAQQALRAADAIYREGMAYYFTPGVAATLSPGTVKAFEAVRTGFDPAYKTAQSALDAYQAGKRKDVIAEMAALAKLMNAILPYFVHPNIQAVPLPVAEVR